MEKKESLPAQTAPNRDLEIQPSTANANISPVSIFDPNDESILAGINPDALKGAEQSALNIATQYYDFQLGQPVRAFFLGTTTAKTVNQQTSEEVWLPAIVFIDETRTMYINSAVKLVAAVEKLEAGTPIQITWTGTKKTGSGGQMRVFDVRILRTAQ